MQFPQNAHRNSLIAVLSLKNVSTYRKIFFKYVYFKIEKNSYKLCRTTNLHFSAGNEEINITYVTVLEKPISRSQIIVARNPIILFIISKMKHPQNSKLRV